jgi:DNA-binding FadR family transcriptional regulator
MSNAGRPRAGSATPVSPDASPPRRAGLYGPALRHRANGSDVLQERIKQLILSEGLSPGDPMPTEVDLVDRLDAGRSSVREALKALQAVGIVEIKHGFGMYVGAMSLSGLIDGLVFQSQISLDGGQRDLRNLIDIREVIENGMLTRLLSDGSPPDLTAVESVLAAMKREALRGPVEPETDRLFHEVLYQSLDNPLLGPLLGAFWNVSNEAHGIYAKSREKPNDTVRRHEAIYRAVKSADLPRALKAMTEHFDGVRVRLRSRT